MSRDGESKPAGGSAPDEVVMAKAGTGASAIIAQKIPKEKTEAFLEWQRGIARATTDYDGYDRTEVYPPVEGAQEEWVTILHFKSNDALENWLKSDTRAEWNKRFTEEFGEFELKKMATGLGILFPPGPAPIPDWKSMLIVVLGLYPTVLILNATVMLPFNFLPLTSRMLIGNILCASALQWVVIPATFKAFKWWVEPSKDQKDQMRINAIGALIIIVALLIMDFLFTMFLH